MRMATAIAVASLVMVWDGRAMAAAFAVNSLADGVDAAPGNGVCATLGGACTLRAAIQESNALPGADQVNLAVGVHELTINGADEDAAASGDLDITDDLTIAGINAYLAVIDANSGDRVLDQRASDSTLTLRDLTLRGGSVVGNGGGLRHTGAVSAERIIVTGNTVSGYGGGIAGTSPLVPQPALTLAASIISLNEAETGSGGIGTEAGPLAIDRSIIIANTGGECGGIVANGDGSPTTSLIRRTTIYGNHAAGSGGGACIAVNVRIEQSWISHNLASPGWGQRPVSKPAINDGGGIYVGGPSSEIVNSTIDGNLAFHGGGFFGERDTAIATLSNVTVARNVAVGAQGGGGVYEDISAEITLENTVLAENVNGNCGGGVSAGGVPNLSDDATCFGALHADAMLGSLGNYGGQTQTIPPLVGSPAFNGAQNLGLAVDQRGVSRPQLGGFDLGAVEKQKLVLPERYRGGFAPRAQRCDLDRNGRIDFSDLHLLIASFPPFGGNYRGDADAALKACVAVCTHAGCSAVSVIKRARGRPMVRG